jgi:hypothetical protein
MCRPKVRLPVATPGTSAPLASAHAATPEPSVHGGATAAVANETLRLLLALRRPQPGRLTGSGCKSYSQGDEDGLLAETFRRIGDGDRTFLELGAGDGRENNTRALAEAGWHGAWLEQDAGLVEKARERLARRGLAGRVRVRRHLATATKPVPDDLPFPANLDLLSVDIDGNDWHVLRALLRRTSPRVIILEYNARYLPGTSWVMPYDEQHSWDGSDWFGASLTSFALLLADHALVGCSLTGVNAIFVRKDQPLARFHAPGDVAEHWEPARYHLIEGWPAAHPERAP